MKNLKKLAKWALFLGLSGLLILVWQVTANDGESKSGELKDRLYRDELHEQQMIEKYSKLPLCFVQNKGQMDEKTKLMRLTGREKGERRREEKQREEKEPVKLQLSKKELARLYPPPSPLYRIGKAKKGQVFFQMLNQHMVSERIRGKQGVRFLATRPPSELVRWQKIGEEKGARSLAARILKSMVTKPVYKLRRPKNPRPVTQRKDRYQKSDEEEPQALYAVGFWMSAPKLETLVSVTPVEPSPHLEYESLLTCPRIDSIRPGGIRLPYTQHIILQGRNFGSDTTQLMVLLTRVDGEDPLVSLEVRPEAVVANAAGDGFDELRLLLPDEIESGDYAVTVHKPNNWGSNHAFLRILPAHRTCDYVVVYVNYFDVITNSEDPDCDPAEIVWVISVTDGEHTIKTRFPADHNYGCGDGHRANVNLPVFAVPLEDAGDCLAISMTAVELDGDKSSPGWVMPLVRNLGRLTNLFLEGRTSAMRSGADLAEDIAEDIQAMFDDPTEGDDCFGVFGQTFNRDQGQDNEMFGTNRGPATYWFNQDSVFTDHKMDVCLQILKVPAPRVEDVSVSVNSVQVHHVPEIPRNLPAEVFLRMRAYDDFLLGDYEVEIGDRCPETSGAYAMEDGQYVPGMSQSPLSRSGGHWCPFVFLEVGIWEDDGGGDIQPIGVRTKFLRGDQLLSGMIASRTRTEELSVTGPLWQILRGPIEMYIITTHSEAGDRATVSATYEVRR